MTMKLMTILVTASILAIGTIPMATGQGGLDLPPPPDEWAQVEGQLGEIRGQAYVSADELGYEMVHHACWIMAPMFDPCAYGPPYQDQVNPGEQRCDRFGTHCFQPDNMGAVTWPCHPGHLMPHANPEDPLWLINELADIAVAWVDTVCEPLIPANTPSWCSAGKDAIVEPGTRFTAPVVPSGAGASFEATWTLTKSPAGVVASGTATFERTTVLAPGLFPQPGPYQTQDNVPPGSVLASLSSGGWAQKTCYLLSFEICDDGPSCSIGNWVVFG